jgi:anti-sigma regulatory factor (Ser/Thr protein kinase)
MLELAFDADPSALATMADAVEDYAATAGVTPERAMQLVIALDEILTNIMTHGRLGSGDGIAVTVEAKAGALSAVVEDPGPPFDPLRDAPPPVLSGSVAERPIGGLGLHIAKTLARRIEYERRDGRNRLSLELPP